MVELRSTITCPACGHRAAEIMPADACQYFYECKRCGLVMKSEKGDCCVFCSFGDVPCPPIQEYTGCCGTLPDDCGDGGLCGDG
ncbi:MAG: GDCCVxC domain-containing (seleno)protein [Rhodomicrobium sp.]